jgi:hypothetical protein
MRQSLTEPLPVLNNGLKKVAAAGVNILWVNVNAHMSATAAKREL